MKLSRMAFSNRFLNRPMHSAIFGITSKLSLRFTLVESLLITTEGEREGEGREREMGRGEGERRGEGIQHKVSPTESLSYALRLS